MTLHTRRQIIGSSSILLANHLLITPYNQLWARWCHTLFTHYLQGIWLGFWVLTKANHNINGLVTFPQKRTHLTIETSSLQTIANWVNRLRYSYGSRSRSFVQANETSSTQLRTGGQRCCPTMHNIDWQASFSWEKVLPTQRKQKTLSLLHPCSDWQAWVLCHTNYLRLRGKIMLKTAGNGQHSCSFKSAMRQR